MQQIIRFKKPWLVETHYVFHLNIHKNDFPKILSVSIDFNPGYPVLSGQSVVRRLSVSVMDKNRKDDARLCVAARDFWQRGG